MSIRDHLANVVHIVAAALLITSVVVMAVQVGLRLFFNAPLSWPEEVVRYSFVWVVYLGSVVAISRDSHIRVLVMIEPYGPRVRVFSDVLSWLVNVFCCGFMLYWGIDLAWQYKDARFYTLPDWSQLWYYLALPVPMVLSLFFLFYPSGRSSDSAPRGETPL